ncbi:hypothetical protein P3T76_004703 [Phytophthora citrophthora]|uniref:Uncharacterized protein n=1 Tax=Phytophthora citrophthora TaxID=4793 RepID=A0AAD9GR62_9STRA|nr:hypothetical protein P3T76_004703 [Phytophthora citrophthora]
MLWEQSPLVTINSAKSQNAICKIRDIPVNVKAKLPDDIPLADTYKGGEFVFVRKCYAEYYLKVEDLLVEKDETCVTVTGTPDCSPIRIVRAAGIGKSVFYAFFGV